MQLWAARHSLGQWDSLRPAYVHMALGKWGYSSAEQAGCPAVAHGEGRRGTGGLQEGRPVLRGEEQMWQGEKKGIEEGWTCCSLLSLPGERRCFPSGV